VNRTLLLRTFAAARYRIAIVALALVAWGVLMPVIYASFGRELRDLIDSPAFPFPRQFTQFGGGDITTLPGSISLGFVHPIAVALIGVFAIGGAAGAIAGERQRGTLEVLLSRPIGRRALYATVFTATAAIIGLLVLATIVGAVLGSVASDVLDELAVANLPAVWLNGVLLYVAFAAVGLAASVSFDRLAPALGITLGVAIVSYFLEIIGSLWPDAKWLQPYSLFHYFQPGETLTDGPQLGDLSVLAAVTAAAVVYALVVFPRRDIAAPS
jgi:ABC-2 type transport system permease protein